MKPTASCEAAQLWVNMPIPKWVPRRGTYTSRLIFRMIVGPALRNQKRERWCLSHSCAPSELAVGFWWIRVPSGHGADWCSAMGGCEATARRHSLLSLSAYRLKNMLVMSHANITQMVKTCYKIKIGFRDFACPFCGVLQRCDTLIYQYSHFCTPIVPLLECKSGSFIW